MNLPPTTATPLTMRHRVVTVLGALVATVALGGCLLVAPTDPGPLRYRDEVFSGVTTTLDVPYGAAVAQDGTDVTLYFDLYEPQGDDAALRPLIIWIHGGSFRSGSRTSAELVDQANVFARKGYVNASISYRLANPGCVVINAQCVEAIVDATEDAQAAVRFFRAHAEDYGIDPNRIAVAGTSAGAITALHVGYRASVPGDSGTPGVSSRVSAAVSLSGANFIATCEQFDAPALMFHGTTDPLVPHAWAQNTLTCAEDAGSWAEMITWEGQGHVPYVQNRAEIIATETTFLFNALNVRGLL
ncbi:MAG: alpha/beta hydrolase [Acidimicrobiales bacterium]|nr:alpha/beta hydrolase [Acidimicrobiales bacterium]